MWLFSALLFLFGLTVGSFLNVLIYRLPRGLNIARGRSFCPKCKKKIAWYDNIPLLSFVLLRGKCRRCGQGISWRYPIVELLTGVSFLLVGLGGIGGIGEISEIRMIGETLLSLTFICALIVVFFTDLETMIIPDEIILPTSLLFLGRYGLTDDRLLTGAISFGFLGCIYLITNKKGMGFGDVKLALLMGLALGYPNIIVAFYIAFLTGALLGIILIVFGKAKWKAKIPFGPFLCLGTVIAYFWGEKIVGWVTKILI